VRGVEATDGEEPQVQGQVGPTDDRQPQLQGEENDPSVGVVRCVSKVSAPLKLRPYGAIQICLLLLLLLL